MTVTRDVVIDLLPLYLSGEVSDDSRRLVDAFLAADPQLARLARAGDFERREAVPLPVSAAAPREALARTRQLLARKQVFLGAAIALSLLPLSFRFAGRGVVWVMWRDDPGMAVAYAAGAVLCWINYLRMRSRLRVTGL